MDHRAPQASRPSMGSLLSGLVTDVKDLFVYEVAAAKLEIQEELDQAKHTAISLGIGVGVSVVGGLLLAFMLVHILAAYVDMPLWGCYGIVGGILTILGVMFLYKGKRRAEHIHLPPQETAVAAKEDIEWIKNQVMSDGR